MIFILQPDADGNCCDCAGRMEPCDSCESTCFISGNFSTSGDARDFIESNKSGANCFIEGSAGYSYLNAGDRCVTTTGYSFDIPFITAYSNTGIFTNATTSAHGDCGAGNGIYIVDFRATVPSGTLIRIDYNLSASRSPVGPAYPGFSDVAIRIGLDSGPFGPFIVNDGADGNDVTIANHVEYLTSGAACLSALVQAESRVDWTDAGSNPLGVDVSAGFIFSMTFSQPFTASPIRAGYALPIGGVIICP